MTRPCLACREPHDGDGMQCAKCVAKPRGSIPAATRKDATLPEGCDSMWEAEYRQHLEALKRAGAIRGYVWKGMRFRLVVTEPGKRDRWYTPEAIVWPLQGRPPEVHEVKGHQREAGMLRFDVAADRYPMFRWRMVAKDGGRWVTIRGTEWAA